MCRVKAKGLTNVNEHAERRSYAINMLTHFIGEIVYVSLHRGVSKLARIFLEARRPILAADKLFHVRKGNSSTTNLQITFK